MEFSIKGVSFSLGWKNFLVLLGFTILVAAATMLSETGRAALAPGLSASGLASPTGMLYDSLNYSFPLFYIVGLYLAVRFARWLEADDDAHLFGVAAWGFILAFILGTASVMASWISAAGPSAGTPALLQLAQALLFVFMLMLGSSSILLLGLYALARLPELGNRLPGRAGIAALVAVLVLALQTLRLFGGFSSLAQLSLVPTVLWLVSNIFSAFSILASAALLDKNRRWLAGVPLVVVLANLMLSLVVGGRLRPEQMDLGVVFATLAAFLMPLHTARGRAPDESILMPHARAREPASAARPKPREAAPKPAAKPKSRKR